MPDREEMTILGLIEHPERWKMIRSLKVDALPLVVRLDDPAVSTDSAEVFEVVRADDYRGAVDLLCEAREWIDNAGDFMARPMDLLARMDAALPDHPRGQYVLEADQPRGAICDAAAHLLRVLDRFDNAPVSAVDAMDRLRTALGGQCAAHPRRQHEREDTDG